MLYLEEKGVVRRDLIENEEVETARSNSVRDVLTVVVSDTVEEIRVSGCGRCEQRWRTRVCVSERIMHAAPPNRACLASTPCDA